ncbi:MAG: diaminopimelate decarboxylase [Fidelibacterota bacterium]
MDNFKHRENLSFYGILPVMKHLSHPLLPLLKQRSLLESMAREFGTPLYLYSGDRLKDNLRRMRRALKEAFPHGHICYAIKANNNPHLIRFLKGADPALGADCSSPGELWVAKQASLRPTECIYTGNYESPEDLQAALAFGAVINLDDTTSFQRLQRIGLPELISFRLNPGFGKGAFSQVVTGGREAKFGIPPKQIMKAYQQAQKAGIKRFGLQCMSGSGILDQAYFVTLLKAILETVQTLWRACQIQMEFISIGGGFGIPYAPEEQPLDIRSLFQDLKQIYFPVFDKRRQKPPTLWIEPGKYIVGDAGMLLTRVTGIKKSYRTFIGLDAGMETLMRPSLYQAYHRIVKVQDPESPPTQTVDITGRICENTDRLAVERPFPEVTEGELIAVLDVGAYGFAMSHQFNTRPRAAEILLDGNQPHLIRKRETIEDIFSNCTI